MNPGQKIISLTNSDKIVIVDEEDFEHLSQWNWQFFKSSGHAGRCQWINGKSKTFLLHREINKTPDHLFTDHVNGDKLDNRKKNLRNCNKSQNGMNRPKQKGVYSSIYKGVTWCKTMNKWKARVKANRKYYSLGYHETQEKAALEYNTYAYIYHGEFARFNKVIL